MKQNRYVGLLLIFLMTLVLASCGNSQSEPAQAIEAYFQALAAKDRDALVNLSCNEWEENALVELDSLTGVSAEVNELNCQASGQEGDDRLVNCTGGLELNYNGEIQALDLSARTLIARQEDGEWRACGYK